MCYLEKICFQVKIRLVVIASLNEFHVFQVLELLLLFYFYFFLFFFVFQLLIYASMRLCQPDAIFSISFKLKLRWSWFQFCVFPLYCFIFASWFKLSVVHISQNLLSCVGKLYIDVCELIFFLFAKYATSLCDYFWFEGRILVIVSSVVYVLILVLCWNWFVYTKCSWLQISYKHCICVPYCGNSVYKWNELILAIWWCITVWVTFFFCFGKMVGLVTC